MIIFFSLKAGKDIQAAMANPDDFDAMVHGKVHNGWLDEKKADDAKEKPTINYDYDPIMYGKKKDAEPTINFDIESLWSKADDAKEEPTTNYDNNETHYISIEEGLKDYFECEKCGDLHRQGEQCDNDTEITNSPNHGFTIIPNPEATSSNVREKTYMSDSEGDSDDEDILIQWRDDIRDDNVVYYEELSE